jgi:hypothetical protein
MSDQSPSNPMPDELRQALLARGTDPETIREWARDEKGRYVVRLGPFADVVDIKMTLLPLFGNTGAGIWE